MSYKTESELLQEIKLLLKKKAAPIISIDGRCGSGKTTIAEYIAKEIGAEVVHADDFFLPPYMRSEKRLATPGENIDHERLEKEVLLPFYEAVKAKEKMQIAFRPYICSLKALGGEKRINTERPLVVEGSYSQHPSLCRYYDLKVFVDCEADVQIERIRRREGEDKLRDFVGKWIPLEEKYFDFCKVKDIAEIVILNQEKKAWR